MKRYLSLTAVAYEADDLLGYIMAYCSLLPHAILIVQASALVLAESKQRRIQAGSILAGQIINEAINTLLKSVFRQPRPGGIY